MLELSGKSAFSNEYFAREGGAVVARMRRAIWRQQAVIRIDARTLLAKARGVMRRSYLLGEGSSTLLELRQPSGWRSRVVFRFRDRDYEVLHRPWYKSTQVLLCEGSEVGRIEFRGLLRTHLEIDLPESLPLEVRIFLGWLALLRRDEAAAAGSGA